MQIVPGLLNTNVVELLNVIVNPQAFKNISKTIAKELPKAAIQQSTKPIRKAWDTVSESVAKSLRETLLKKDSPPVATPKTIEKIAQDQKNITEMGKNFQTTMSEVRFFRVFNQLKNQNPEQILEQLKELDNELEEHSKKTHSTLGVLLTHPESAPTEVQLESEIEKVPTPKEQVKALKEKIAKQLDQLVPLKADVFTHKVEHSTAPSWLALLLDSTYEPNYIEKLSALITTFKEKGLEGITDKFIKEAEEYTEKPLDTLAGDATFKTIPDTSAYMLADAASMFLGVLSLVRGYQEFTEANHEIKHLQHERKLLKDDRKDIDILNNILGGNLPTGLVFNKTLNTAKLDRNQRGQETAKLDKKIAFSAMGAGFTSALKGLSDITVKTGLAIKSFATGHGLLGGAAIATKGSAAGIAATASGAASTIALGPLAGLFAVGLGAGFLRKTSLKLNQLNKDFSATEVRLQAMHDLLVRSNSDPNAADQLKAFSTYKAFIETQGAKRTQFFSHFKNWNKAFLVGAGLYTASSAAKAGIIAASLLGATAVASNPVGWGVLTGVGIAAAIGLGISTLGFIKGHVRQTRYNQQTAGDHALVDRHFLVNAQNLNRQATEGDSSHGNPPPYWEGMQLAASNLDMLNTRADTIQKFLEKAATGTESIAPFSDRLNVLQRLRGKTLGKTKFNDYLGRNDKFKALIQDVIQPDLEKQSLHIQQKLVFREQHQKEHLLSKEQIEIVARSEQAPQALKAYGKHLKRMANKALMDVERLKQVSDLSHELKLLQNSEKIEPQQQPEIKKRLLQHWGVKVVDKQDKPLDEEKINTLFAKHMVYTQRKEVEMAKGVLFEAQLQAQHMNSLAVEPRHTTA